MDKEQGTAPLLRFKGYTDAWVQRKLGEVAERTTGGGTPSTSNDELWGTGYPWIQSSDLVEHDISAVNVRKYVTPRGINESAAKLIPQNSIAIVTRVGVGKLAVIPFEYATSQDFLSLSDLNLDTLFSTYSIYRRLQKELNQVQGTSIKGITKDELLNKSIVTPLKSEEQTTIGNFFHTLDNTITLHKRKLDGLRELKNGYLQQMFPQDGESVPRLRFSEFTETWQEKKLDELLTERNEQTEESDEYPLMSFVGNVGVVPKGEQYDRSFLVKDDSKKYKRTELGDFIYSSNNLETGSIGFNKTGKAVISPVYSIFFSNNAFESQFVGLLSKRKDFINKMIHFRQGVMYGQWRIHEKDFLKIKILAPSIVEQNMIVDFFRSTDIQIEVMQTKLEKLVLLKRAYLQRMFV